MPSVLGASMELFCISNREKVLERWKKLLTNWRPRTITLENINNSVDCSECVVLFHISSFSESDILQMLQIKQSNMDNLILIACTDAPEDNEGIRVLQGGANGYTNTYITGSLLIEVVETVLHGDIWAGPELLQKMLKRLLHGDSTVLDKISTIDTIAKFDELSEREHQVLSVLILGASNKEIARELDITERTVKAHLSSIFKKTGISDRVSLAITASKQLSG